MSSALSPLLDTVELLTKHLLSFKMRHDREEGGKNVQLKYYMITIEDFIPKGHILRKKGSAELVRLCTRK